MPPAFATPTFRAHLRRLIRACPGTAGVVIEDPLTGAVFRHNADVVFPAASIIKLYILWEFYQQISNGRLSPHERLPLPEADKVGGSGVLFALQAGLPFTLNDLATLMTIVSDNTATNLLIDRLSLEAINQSIQQLGLTATSLQRKMMDYARARLGFQNVTTAAETAVLLRALLQPPTPTSPDTTAMLTILRQQQFNDRLSLEWPEEIPFAHKTGSIPGSEHDAGIWLRPHTPLILVVLTQNCPTNAHAIHLCQAIGRAIYRQFPPDSP